jgi:AcrR family transcriptional regulator
MRADARRNYERIVATARDVFLEHGIEAPLDDIAKRAEVGPGTLYRHFPSRDALIEAVYRNEIEELAHRAHVFAEELPPDEAVREWMRAQVHFVVHRAGLATALKAAIDQDSATFRYCTEKLHDAVAAVLAPAQAAGTIRADLEPTDLLRLGHGIGAGAKYADEAGMDRLLSVVLAGLSA